MSEHPWNEKNIIFKWLSSLYNLFNYQVYLKEAFDNSKKSTRPRLQEK